MMNICVGLFRTQNLINGFHLIVKIPAGATRINVTEGITLGRRNYLGELIIRVNNILNLLKTMFNKMDKSAKNFTQVAAYNINF